MPERWLIDLFRYFRWLSLDVSVGAISVLYLLARSFQLSVSLAEFIALFSAIWSIYLFDHYKDGQAVNVMVRRRLFYKARSVLILVLLFLALSAGLASVFFLPRMVQITGFWLAGICVFYVLLSRLFARLMLKEFMVASGFAVGVILPVWVRMGSVTVVGQVGFSLWLLALSNLLIFACFEADEDRQEGFFSIGTLLPRSWVNRFAALSLIICVAAAAMFPDLPWSFRMFVLAGAVGLSFLMVSPRSFERNERYRLMGDGIFLLALPLALL